MTFEYKQYDALGLAELVKTKQVKRTEVVDMAYREIEKKNEQLHAIINVIDREVALVLGEKNDGIFTGVPVLTKNIQQDIKGQPITGGSRALVDQVAVRDSEFVSQVKTTGVSIIGQTNVPEFALMGITEPAYNGPTRNPWNLDYTPGGSSGGSAAAVAAGIVPIAGANDGGGSIRIPAAFSGLFGLKPTRGRTPIGPDKGRQWQGASVEHILSRSVRDSAAMLDQYSFDRASAFLAPRYTGSYQECVNKPLNKPLNIAFSTRSPIGMKVDPECQKAVENTVKLFQEMGHHVEEKDAPVDGNKLANSFMMLYFGEVASTISTIENKVGRKLKYNEMEPSTWLLGLLGRSVSAADFVLSLQEWDIAAYQMDVFHDQFDLYITPTTAFPPSKIGELELTVVEKQLIKAIKNLGLASVLKKTSFVDSLIYKSLERTPFTQLANLTGQPAMSAPLHITEKGLPCGVQFMARRGREDLLMQVAGELEQTDLWTNVADNPMFRL
ncbi:amidase [Radiobacillus sp. PE A8.2]|uniref:amidase n=1 Tax=Radiobacillus sp. PE A8.2 TaxID=3380349 RepID=UPI00388FD516